MRLNPVEILSRLNSSYWFVPLLVTLGGVALAVMMIRLDSPKPFTPGAALELLHPSSAEGARALLAAVIGAMITALSVTFSVTIVALTVAAQHFGPRVLNKFVRHTSAQIVLGTFIATFVYSVLVLGAIEGGGQNGTIPELAVAGAVTLVVLSVGALIYYVHHVATALQIGELAGEIANDFQRSVERLHSGEERRPSGDRAEIPEAPARAAQACADESGYVQRIDYDGISRLAQERDAVVWMRREPGAFVVAGTPLALVDPPEACDGRFAEELRDSCIVGRDRTLWHDTEFAVKQLVEIALRALSPGVNEPFTAMTCVDRLTEGLAVVLRAPEPRAAWRDRAGAVRVYTQPQPFATLLRAAFDPIRIFAGPNPAIYVRLLEGVAELALVAVRPGDRDALRHQADLIRRAAERSLADGEADDLAYVLARYEKTAAQFEHKPGATRR